MTDGSWSFRAEADLFCQLVPTDADWVELLLAPTPPTRQLDFSWRGLAGTEVVDARSDAATGGLRVRAKPSAGSRVVQLRVIRNISGDQRLLDNVFSSMTATSATGSRLSLAVDRYDELKLLGALWQRGVTGLGVRKLAGVLVRGPLARIEVDPPRPGSVAVEVENTAGGPVHVRLAGGGRETSAGLDPTRRTVLELDLASEPSRVTIDVEQDGHGLVLIGKPRFSHPSEDARPSVVLITLDTTRRDALEPWGAPQGRSPNLAAFASRSDIYDLAWATSPWTLPSHASMMTGLYPTRHAAGVGEARLLRTRPILADVLREAGWFTAGVAGGEMCASRWGLAHGFDVFVDPAGFESPGDVVTRAALESAEQADGRPVMLFVNYFDPHALYAAPEPFKRRFEVAAAADRLEPGSAWRRFADGDGESWRAIIDGEAPATADALEWLRAAYAAEVAYMDDQVGRLLDGLQGLGILDNAIVIIAADHGEFLGEHGYFSHACRLDPELTWIPMMVSYPGQSTSRRVAALVSHVDVFATVLEVVGLEVPVNDGVSLLDPEALAARQRVFMEEHETRSHPLFDHMKIAPSVFGMQFSDHREVVWSGGATCERMEGGSWTSAECRATWSERLDELGTIARTLEHRDRSADPSMLTAAEREALEALGYVK